MPFTRLLRGYKACRAGRHSPSERSVREEAGVTVARCRYCSRRLWRRAKRDWVAFEVEQPQPLAEARLAVVEDLSF